MKRLTKEERDRKSLIEYVQTAILTLTTVIVLIGLVIYDAAISAENRMSSVVERIASRFKVETINDLKEQSERRPNDYRINLRLAAAYEAVNEFLKTEEEYQKALSIDPRNQFVLYSYAIFCVSRGRVDDGIILIENIPDTNDRAAVLKKLTFYQYAGNQLFERGDYLNAAKLYDLGVKYGKIIGGKKNEQIRLGLIDSTLLLADEEIAKNNSEQAKIILQTLLKQYDDPEARYKLALIYLPTDPEKSVKTMVDLMDTDPQLINYEILYLTLKYLAEQATDVNLRKYYEFRMEKIKKFMVKNVVYGDEFSIKNLRIVEDTGFFNQKVLSFDIQNTLESGIAHLDLQIDISFPDSKPLIKQAYADLENGENKINVFISPMENFSNSAEAKVEIYGRKNTRFDWTLLHSADISIK